VADYKFLLLPFYVASTDSYAFMQQVIPMISYGVLCTGDRQYL